MRPRMRFGDVRAIGATGLSQVMARFEWNRRYGGPPVPANTVAPVISGSAPSGSTLTSTTGTWLNTPTSYSYQWKSDSTNVGADQNTYVTQVSDEGHTITVVVTATNAFGSASAISNGITVTVPYVPGNFTGHTYLNTSEWHEIAWNGLTGASARYVAVSGSGANRAATSSDGASWTLRTAASASIWEAVCFGTGTRAGICIAVASSPSGGAETMIMKSTNSGATWTSKSAPNVNAYKSVCYSESLDMFVAVSSTGTGNRVMYSTDGGDTWTDGVSAADSDWTCVRFADGRFLAVAEAGAGDRVMTSTNGTSWTSYAGKPQPWQGCTYDSTAAHWVAVGQAGGGNATTETMYSTDHGATWTYATASADQSWNGIDSYSGVCVAVSGSGSTQRSMYTNDGGVTWTPLTTPSVAGWQSVVHGDGLWIAVSNAGGASDTMTAV